MNRDMLIDVMLLSFLICIVYLFGFCVGESYSLAYASQESARRELERIKRMTLPVRPAAAPPPEQDETDD